MREIVNIFFYLFQTPNLVVATVRGEVRVAPPASVFLSTPVVASLIIASLLAVLLALL